MVLGFDIVYFRCFKRYGHVFKTKDVYNQLYMYLRPEEVSSVRGERARCILHQIFEVLHKSSFLLLSGGSTISMILFALRAICACFRNLKCSESTALTCGEHFNCTLESARVILYIKYKHSHY